MSCTFCDLIQGAAEVSVCYEDGEAIAFMDIQPVNAGHVLVVPRQHYESLLDVPPELGAHLFAITMKLAGAVRRVTGCEGMNLVVNSGVAAGQDVFHYHVHIIPRRKGDGFDIELPFAGSEMPDRTVLDMTAARILAAMRDPMRGNAAGGTAGGAGGSGGRMADTAFDAAAPRTTARDDMDAAPALRAVNGYSGVRPTGERAVEVPVAVPVSREGVVAASPPAVRPWAVMEGPHGELVPEFEGAL